MTVKELKENLEYYPDDATVYIPCYENTEYGSFVYADVVTDEVMAIPDAEKSVFIL